jgi:hypothetical protein
LIKVLSDHQQHFDMEYGKKMKMIYEKIYAENLVYIVFCIYDAMIFCKLFGDDKITSFHRKKYEEHIYLYFINIKIFFIVNL